MANTIIDQIKNFRKYIFHEEIFPNEFVEDNFIVRPDGNLSAAFELLLPERESVSGDDIKPFMDRMTSILEQLPTGTACHIQSQYYYRHSNLQALAKQSLGYITSRLMDYHQDKPMLHHRVVMYVIFNFKNRSTPNPLSHFFASFSFWPKNALKDIVKHKLLARSAVQSMMKNMESVPGIKIKQLGNNDIWKEQLRYFNLNFDGDPNFYSNNIHNKGSEVQVGNKKLAFVYLQREGPNIFDYTMNDRNVPSFMAWPMGFSLNFPHLVNFAFIVEDKDKIMKRLENKGLKSKSLGSAQNVNDRSMNLDIEVFLQNNRTSERKLVSFNHNIMVWDTDPEKVNIHLDMVKAAYLRMNGSIGATDSYNNGLLFHTFAPGYGLDLFHSLVLPSDVAVNYFDFTSPHVSDQKGIIFSNREGEPVLVDLWHPNLPSFNRICIGPSGSGKSFTLGYILAQEIEQAIELVVIDVGGSYKNLFELYPKSSKYYEYKHEVPLSFNPFLIPKNKFGKYELSKDKVVFLNSLLTILWKKTSEGESLTPEERSVLTNLLQLYYNHVNTEKQEIPRLDRFLDFIEQYRSSNEMNQHVIDDLKFVNLDSLRVVLKTFTEGIYKDILNSDETENIADYKLICFDLNGIQKDPILYPIVGLLIIELVLDKVRANPTVKKEIVIDEAWSMLTGALSEFIETMYRTVRKAGGAVTIVSQDITPIIKSAIGEAVRGNAPTKILLDHNSQSAMLPDLQQFFALTDHQIHQLMSIRNEGHRREILLIRNQVAQNFFVDAGPHASLAFSSWAPDRSRISQLSEKAGVEYAINQYANEKAGIV